jgi:hypothetical protein
MSAATKGHDPSGIENLASGASRVDRGWIGREGKEPRAAPPNLRDPKKISSATKPDSSASRKSRKIHRRGAPPPPQALADSDPIACFVGRPGS